MTMLRSVLDFFQRELSVHLKLEGADKSEVLFPDLSAATGGESIAFKPEALNLLVVNLEEENTLRQADAFRYERNGKSFTALPEIRLNLYLLFVANRGNYLISMDMLSKVIRFFQNRRVFEPRTAPGLPEDIEKLTVELVTLPFAQQNEIWNALRTHYKPSLLYKVRMVVFTPEDPLESRPVIVEKVIQTSD